MADTGKNELWRGRVKRYAPLLLWIGMIFLFSSSVGASSNTSFIIRPLLLWFFPDISEPSIQAVQFWVRKTGHFTEYAILACWALRAFKNSSYRVLRSYWFLSSLLLVITVACADEFYQGFFAYRTSSPYDSLLDIVGGATALFMVWLFWPKNHEQAQRP